VTFADIMKSGEFTKIQDLLEEAFEALGKADPGKAALEMVEAMKAHKLTVVRGTDQLRAHNYALKFDGANSKGNELHHLLPLYLGGDHTRLVSLAPSTHDDIHKIMGAVEWGDQLLKPSSVAKNLSFDVGGAVLHSDGTITMAKLGADGTWTKIEGR
jgi:hypothetical protein